MRVSSHYFHNLRHGLRDAQYSKRRSKPVSSNEESYIKTMFVSHEKDGGKKTFQKPNILRRKAKLSGPRPDRVSVKESLGFKSPVTSIHVGKATISGQHLEPLTQHCNKQTNTKSVLKLTIANNNDEETNVKSQETDIDANVNSNAMSNNSIQLNNIDKSIEQGSLNVESFINGGVSAQSMLLPNIDVMPSSEQNTTQAKPKWSFDLTSNPLDVMINSYNVPQLAAIEQKSDYMIDAVPSVIPASIQQPSLQLQQVICSSTPNRNVSVELISNKAVKFKCDEPNCNKGFWTAERLTKHKASHRRAGAGAGAGEARALLTCPVRRAAGGAGGADGADGAGAERCPRAFGARRDLLRHLDADHEPADAPHRCEVCGRRFFWASGLRAHAQSVCARGGLACAWPGCGRVFRLPCRLREHARAHTGDRPYLCRYPECGWAFRSASKLVRHARRHTDERRHVCGACGRAFLRREHLRDHAARHHAPHARPTHLCPHAGCEQTFTNMSTLYMHMKKVHRKDEIESEPAGTDQTRGGVDSGENIYLVSVVEAEGIVEGAGPDLWTHAARTHCTWPLASRRAPPPAPAPPLAPPLGSNLALEEDTHAESGSGCARAVRSDLFLAGAARAHSDDDSANIGVTATAAGGEGTPQIDSDLCLINSDPTIDLMQEELMYEDGAVDESSFRVLLMSGHDLA